MKIRLVLTSKKLILLLLISSLTLAACLPSRNEYQSFCRRKADVTYMDPNVFEIDYSLEDVQVSPNGTKLAIVSLMKKKIAIYDIQDEGLIELTSFAVERGYRLRWSPNGRFIAFGDLNSNLSIYDFERDEIVDTVFVGVSYSPHFEWSLDSQWIMAMAMQPSLDPTFLAAKMYRVNEGKLIFDREFHFPQDMIDKKGFAVNFDWNRNSPETVQALIRTYTDITFFDEQENQYHYFDFDNLIEFGYLGTYWLENNEFLIINNSSDDLITIYFVTGDKITYTQKAEIVESPEIYGIHSSVLDDSKKVLVSYGWGHESINIHCIQDHELIHVGGIQLPNTQKMGSFLIINSVKKQIYTYNKGDREIHVFDLDEFLKN